MSIAGGFLDLYHDERLDQSEELYFEIAAGHPKSYLLDPDCELRWDGRRFYVVELEAGRRGSTATITVRANALWYRLAEVTRVGSTVLDDLTPRQGLAEILAGTGWTTGPGTTDSSDRFSLEQQDATVLGLLRSWARVTGRTLSWDTSTKEVTLADRRGRDLALAFRYGRNLTGVRRRRTPPALTILYPYGADGLSIAGVNGGLEYIEDFTYYTSQGLSLAQARARYSRSAVWSDSRFLVDSQLLAAAQEQLARLSGGSATYELQVVDLSELSFMSGRVQVGDTVRVSDPDFAADLRVSVVRLKRYPLQPWRNEVELAGIPDPMFSGDGNARASSSQEWLQFVGPVGTTYPVRNDGTYTVARIPLQFREGGRANYHLDLFATGVGAGSLLVEVYEAVSELVVFRDLSIPYTDGQQIRATLSWAAEGLSGQTDYRIRVTTIADGGPSPTAGVDILEDNAGEASWWILAQGAVRQSPTAPNSQTFEFTGAVQTFTVPDNVSEITITARGAQGGGTKGGNGAEATATFQVVPGTVLDVYVGGQGDYGNSSSTGVGGWPNGGLTPATAPGNVAGGQGGGSSDVRPQGSGMASTLLCAGGGGGSNRTGSSRNATDAQGGAGGFFAGTDGWGLSPAQTEGVARAGLGATQFAGGAAGAGGTAGAFNQGGDAGTTSNSFHFAGGGGGGGYYGGGGAGTPVLFGGGSYAGDGGGGSGWVDPAGYDLNVTDGARSGNGQVVISWDTPE